MHDPGGGLIGFISFIGFIIAERLGAFTENPFEDGLYALPINRICATISENLFSIDHPLSFTDLDLTP
jgi:putative membrane protein